MIHYTEPRYTKDIDLWVEPTPDNAARVFRVLALDDVLRAKKMAGRPQDRLDAEKLERAKGFRATKR